MKVSEYFGENVFSRAVMQERLPKKVYAEVMSVVEHGGQISCLLYTSPSPRD